MAIKLVVGKPSYTLYDESQDKYIYFTGGDYAFSLVPKASGMMRSVELMEDKRTRVTAGLTEYMNNPNSGTEHYDRYECGQPGPLANVSKEQLAVIRARNLEFAREDTKNRIKTLKTFVIVRIAAEIVK